MVTELVSLAADAHPGWDRDGGGGPGWWLIFPILFWALVLTTLGYVLYRISPRQSARAAGERALAERYARGEIDETELQRRRAEIRRSS